MIGGQQLVRALDYSEGIVMITDVDGKIDFVNKTFERVYGFHRDEVVGRTPSLLKSGFHSKTFYDELWSTISKGNTWNGDFVNRSKSGEIISEKASISPILSESGDSIIGYIAVKHNISERKKLKEQLDLREHLFESLFENSPVGILIVKPLKSEGEIFDFNIVRANLKSSVVFNRISFIDARLSSVLKNKNINGLLKSHKSIQHGEEIYEWEDVDKGKILEYKLFNLTTDQKCLMIADVSAKVNMENRLKENEAHLRELNETKDKIFGIIAHDLKNPFQALIGFASALNEGLESFSQSEIKQMASQISDVSHQTYKLLDDLLTWSKSQLGQLAPRPVKVNLYKLADKAFAQMTILAKKKNISLINDAQKNAHVKADPDMLEFVVRNLIHNALKFTPPGGVVRFYEVAEGQAITFYVEDTGIGIQPAKVKDIFSLSGNLSTARTSEEAGTGLGLMLSRELVEMNNGTISVKSEPGGGACFMVSLDKSDN